MVRHAHCRGSAKRAPPPPGWISVWNDEVSKTLLLDISLHVSAETYLAQCHFVLFYFIYLSYSTSLLLVTILFYLIYFCYIQPVSLRYIRPSGHPLMVVSLCTLGDEWCFVWWVKMKGSASHFLFPVALILAFYRVVALSGDCSDVLICSPNIRLRKLQGVTITATNLLSLQDKVTESTKTPHLFFPPPFLPPFPVLVAFLWMMLQDFVFN